VGTGPSITETRTLSDFNSISLAMDAEVQITQDSIFKVEVVAQSNIMDKIITQVSGSRLIIQHKNNVILKSNPILIRISMPILNGLNVSGSGKIQLQNLVTTGNFDLNVSGSGKIFLPGITATDISSSISGSGCIDISSGSVITLDSKISGSGDLNMLNVPIEDVNTTTSGSGTTKVYANHTLFAKITGSGDVYSRGNPSVESEISGSGRLIKQ
jgi:hypothetical protein